MLVLDAKGSVSDGNGTEDILFSPSRLTAATPAQDYRTAFEAGIEAMTGALRALLVL